MLRRSKSSLEITSISYLESQASMRIYNSDIVKDEVIEIKHTGTPKFDCRRFCSNPTVSDCEVEHRACKGSTIFSKSDYYSPNLALNARCIRPHQSHKTRLGMRVHFTHVVSAQCLAAFTQTDQPHNKRIQKVIISYRQLPSFHHRPFCLRLTDPSKILIGVLHEKLFSFRLRLRDPSEILIGIHHEKLLSFRFHLTNPFEILIGVHHGKLFNFRLRLTDSYEILIGVHHRKLFSFCLHLTDPFEILIGIHHGKLFSFHLCLTDSSEILNGVLHEKLFCFHLSLMDPIEILIGLLHGKLFNFRLRLTDPFEI
ncbi:uncharacterized protein G2W53_018687 [Senna tora]|uniref:Uncharacterized protein n=1 Tax=Senna tora TaxID=362788 RepID=A0A834WNJ9_9FABA|nr:uncharacterized protein G2W53_018687 [Senna tora]